MDYAFYGRGNGGRQIAIGAERKKIQDLANSVKGTKGRKGEGGRLIHQYRRARGWGCEALMLHVEDIMKPAYPTRELQIRRGEWRGIQPPMMYRDLDNFLNTLFWRLGVYIKRSADPWETSQQLIDAWWWWQEPPEDHMSWARFDEGVDPALLVGKVPLISELVGKLDGFGWAKAEAFRRQFRGWQVLSALEASEEEWKEVEGVGEKLAKSAYEQLREVIK